MSLICHFFNIRFVI